MLGLDGNFQGVPVLCDLQKLGSSKGSYARVGRVGLAGGELGERSVGAGRCDEDAWQPVAMVR